MARNETGSTGIGASLSNLESTIEGLQIIIDDTMKDFEASLTRIAGNLKASIDDLDAILVRFERKLDRAGENLAAIADQTKEAEKDLFLLSKVIQDLLNLNLADAAEKFLKAIFVPSANQKLFKRFVDQDPNQLQNEFENRERELSESGGKAAPKYISDEIRHEQQVLLEALDFKSWGLQEKIKHYKFLISKSKMIEDDPELRKAEESLIELSKVLQKIRKLATSEELRKIIDEGLPKSGLRPREKGALPQPTGSQKTGALDSSLRYPQAENFGGRTIYPGSDPAGHSMRQLDESLEKSAQGYTALADAVERFVTQGGSLNALVAATNSGLQVQSTVLDILRGQVPELGQSLTGLFAETTEGAEGLNRAVAAMGDRFLDAFEGAIVRGESLSDVLKGLGRDLANLALNELETGGFDGLFGMFGKLFGNGTILNAKGDAFSHGRSLTALARGGALTNSIVNRPTLFPMAAGMGLMGEAGPEAVLPLTRLANGDLGVSMPAPAPAAASGPPMQFFIDARGADRDGMRQLAAAVREVKAEVRYVNNTLERRAVGAMAYARGRGGNIARAFGGW